MGSFWRFGFASQSALDGLLADWSPPRPAAEGQGSNGSSTSSADEATPTPTLEQLLEEEDLLQECKANHAKLIEYLSSPYAVSRMLAYVSGAAFEGQPSIEQLQPKVEPPSGSNLLTPNVVASTLPPVETPPKDPQSPTIRAADDEESREMARKRLKYPFLCTEILTMDPWQVTDTIFRDTDTYLIPFWNTILDKTPAELSDMSVQVGHWSKINNLWLTNTRVPQMITFLKTLPNLFPRMLTHLPYVSPIFDILVKLVNTDDSHPQLAIITWLHEQRLVPLVLEMLDPDPRKNKIEAHTPAGDFLRAIVAAASAASASKQQQQQQHAQAQMNKFGEVEHGNGSQSAGVWNAWPNNTLVRELASKKTIDTLLGYMLDSRPIRRQPQSQPHSSIASDAPEAIVSLQRRKSSGATEHDMTPAPKAMTDYFQKEDKEKELPELPATETPIAIDLEQPKSFTATEESAGSEKAEEAVTDDGSPLSDASDLPSAEAATSSLLNSLTLIIDIIRKNNSDFTELQILQYLERLTASGAGEGEGELSDDDEDEEADPHGDSISSMRKKAGGGSGDQTQHSGPSLVDLGPLLTSIAQRLPDLHQLLLTPRSNITPAPTTLLSSEPQEPLTFERFRICELYAELLHCSNMAMFNRVPVTASVSTSLGLSAVNHEVPPPAYDSESGQILGTRAEAFERLSHALNGSPSPSSPLNGSANHAGAGQGIGQDDEGMVEDISLGDNGRPVTADSDMTSSYTSNNSDDSHTKENSEDVLDFLNMSTEGISLEDDAPPLGSLAASGSASTAEASPALGSSVNGKLAGLADAKPSSSSPSPESSVTPPMPTPHAAPVDRSADLPGPRLKQAFVDLHVVPAVLDLFFRFPWNNFLHNVVYDLVQQIFNGKLEPGANQSLCIAAFVQGDGLVNRVLDTVEENAKAIGSGKPGGVRLGHMGHLTLISEEIVKLFYNNAKDILPFIPIDAFDRRRWERYVDSTLRETRERDLQPLGGGISVGMQSQSGSNAGQSVIDVDDEFPPPHAQTAGKGLLAGDDEAGPGMSSPDKSHFARYLASQIGTDYAGNANSNALSSSASSSSSSDSDSSSDDNLTEDAKAAVARRQALQAAGTTSGRRGSAAMQWAKGGEGEGEGSDDEGDSAFDDYDDDAFDQTAQYGGKLKGDFDLAVGSGASSGGVRKVHKTSGGVNRQEKYGFDERFDAFAQDDSDSDGSSIGDNHDEAEEDDGFGPFSDSFATKIDGSVKKAPLFDDDFGASSTSAQAAAPLKSPQKLTPADWNSSFKSSYHSPKDGGKDDFAFQSSFGDDFGDFKQGSSSQANGEGEQEDVDDDFGEFETADDNGKDDEHGDYDFSQSEEPTSPAASATPAAPKSPPPKPALPASSPRSRPPPPPVPSRRRASSSASSAKSETSEPLGPGANQTAHLSKDGKHVEAEVEVDGETVTVQVPRDELALHPDLATE